MKLQILVPQYKEDEKVIKPLLDSIALQQYVDPEDYSVIICNDGTDVILDRDFLNGYPFDVFYMMMATHSGVSAVRNALIDAASADYIMYCDADDMFSSSCGLWAIFEEIQKGQFDIFISAFSEETRTADGKRIFVNHEYDGTFVHGKVHRLAYLRENNIRWREDMTVHEDGYFNLLAKGLTENDRYCPMLFYLWKWNDNSTCRSDPEYLLKTYSGMIDQDQALADEFIRRGKMDAAKYYVTCGVYDVFFTLNEPMWVEEKNKPYRDALERRFKTFIRKYGPLWESIDKKTEVQVMKDYRKKMNRAGVWMESTAFSDWIRRMKYE